MPKYEVNVTYKGQQNYIVDAPDADTASDIASALFTESGASRLPWMEGAVLLGNEYESIEDIRATELPATP